MTMTKKILGIVLAVAMIFGCFTLAFAADTDAASVAVTAGTTTLAAGESTTITVKATTNFAAATISIPVFYDKTLVTVSDVTAGTLTGGSVTTNTDATSAMSDKVFANTGLSSTQYGFVIATFIASPGATVSSALDGAVVVTFKVTAKADVNGTAAVKVVEGSKKTTSNTNGTLYFGSSSTGATVTGTATNVENITLSAASVDLTIGSAAEPVLTGKNGGYVDTARSYVYGVPAGETDLTGYFTVTDGSFTVSGSGTGATLTVLDSKGATFARYILIIFGDVNGDNAVTDADATTIKMAGLGATIADEAIKFAADINGDSSVTDADATVAKMAGLGGEITSNPYAA